jgi:hypothetical protein
MRLQRFLWAWALVLALPCVVRAGQPGKAQARPADAALADVTYDVGDLTAKRGTWATGPAPTGRAEKAVEGLISGLLRVLLQDNPGLAKKFLGKDAPYRIQAVNGARLQVRADKKTQAQVKDLLDAFRRLQGVAVEVECRLYEITPEVYRKRVAGKLPRLPGEPPVFVDPATDETEQKYLEGAPDEEPFYAKLKPLKTGKVTLQHRGQGQIFTWHVAVPYEHSPERFFRKPKLAIAYPGFSFSVTAAVGADRRRTHLKLTQKVTQLAGWQKVEARKLMPNDGVRDVVFEVPVLRESSSTSTFTALDGWPVVVPVLWRRTDSPNDARQLVLVFTARIRIEEEERAIREAEEKERK